MTSEQADHERDLRKADWRPEEIARAYAETITGQPNAWGQYVHPSLGVSHAIMWRMFQMVGEDATRDLIRDALQKLKPDDAAAIGIALADRWGDR